MTIFKNTNRVLLFLALTCMTAFFCFSCSDTVEGDTPKPQKSISVLSSDLSSYTEGVVSSLPAATVNPVEIPDYLVVKGSDLSSLSDDQIYSLIQVCLSGKTLLLDSPTMEEIVNFKTKLDDFLDTEGNKHLKGQCNISPFSPYTIITQMESAQRDGKDLSYEAIALREQTIYFVCDFENEGETEEIESVENASDWTKVEPPEGISQSDGYDVEEKDPDKPIFLQSQSVDDIERVKADSAASFSYWLVDSDSSLYSAPLSESVDNLVKAQTFIYNFKATFSATTYQYDGRFNGRSENVEVVVDVWAACDIDARQDYYLVRTSVVCNNQQLKYSNAWDDVKEVGPYFYQCQLSSTLEHATVRSDQCEPKNGIGSTNFTTGSSFSIGGNVGGSASGPSGGMSMGYSCSKSSSRSIPDLSIVFNGSQGSSASWTYTATSQPEPCWNWVVTECEDTKPILRQAAVFDTYALYNVDSSEAHSPYEVEVLQLDTTAKVQLNVVNGFLIGFMDLRFEYLWKSTSERFISYIRKPCNAFREYIMSFVPPANVSYEEADRLHGIISEYISDWNTIENYYAIGANRVPIAAESCFYTAIKKISDNKNVLQERGFSGKFTFYIQDVSTGSPLASEDVFF